MSSPSSQGEVLTPSTGEVAAAGRRPPARPLFLTSVSRASKPQDGGPTANRTPAHPGPGPVPIPVPMPCGVHPLPHPSPADGSSLGLAVSFSLLQGSFSRSHENTANFTRSCKLISSLSLFLSFSPPPSLHLTLLVVISFGKNSPPALPPWTSKSQQKDRGGSYDCTDGQTDRWEAACAPQSFH